jgi:hypothetical protein
MTSFLSLTLSLVFISIAIIHFSWVLGGKYGLDSALPSKENGERVFNPKRIDTAIVGFGLTAFAFFYLIKSGFIDFQIPGWLMNSGGWLISGIFMLRAMGDFKYVGLFRKINDTKFAKKDRQFFTPLCLFIGIAAVFIEVPF